MKKEVNKLDQNAVALKRWRSRLKRAMTMVDKLEKQRTRLEKAAAKAPAERKSPPPIEPAVEALIDELDIPAFLQRSVATEIKRQTKRKNS